MPAKAWATSKPSSWGCAGRCSKTVWTETGAASVIHLRCALKGNRWDECWNRLNDGRQGDGVTLTR